MNLTSNSIRFLLTIIFAGSLFAIYKLMYPVANQFSAGSIEQTSSLPTLFSGTAFLFLFLAISSLGGLLVLKEK